MRSADHGGLISEPFFEFGPKAYIYGKAVLELARRADALALEHDVQVILTPQYTDISRVAAEVRHVLVFAQHMDSLRPGRGIGKVLPEAIREAGAVGVLLNHSEQRLAWPVLVETMARADEVGLATVVCADDDQQAVAIAALAPSAIIVEAPGQIAVGRPRTGHGDIARTNAAIWAVNPAIRVLHGAGITSARDVYDVVAAGAQGTGSSSAVINAPDPAAMLAEMVHAVRQAWDATHRE